MIYGKTFQDGLLQNKTSVYSETLCIYLHNIYIYIHSFIDIDQYKYIHIHLVFVNIDVQAHII
jgi:hypothetical protein